MFYLSVIRLHWSTTDKGSSGVIPSQQSKIWWLGPTSMHTTKFGKVHLAILLEYLETTYLDVLNLGIKTTCIKRRNQEVIDISLATMALQTVWSSNWVRNWLVSDLWIFMQDCKLILTNNSRLNGKFKIFKRGVL